LLSNPLDGYLLPFAQSQTQSSSPIRSWQRLTACGRRSDASLTRLWGLATLVPSRLPDCEQTRDEEPTRRTEKCDRGNLRWGSSVTGQNKSGVGESRNPNKHSLGKSHFEPSGFHSTRVTSAWQVCRKYNDNNFNVALTVCFFER